MAPNIATLTVKTITGQEKALQDYQGQVLLIVNVASYCGYTSQYKGLETLNQQYQSQGLRVLGFPCNDFGAQEPDSNDKIAQFCETSYGVTFELFDKVKVLGANQHPLYAQLTHCSPAGDVGWNFEKFLVNKQGEVIARYKSSVAPNAPALIADIEKALAA
jgi:glutathione peroxidase